MIGAIIGDIIGSRFEGMNSNPKRKNFTLFHRNTRFTDDTVLSVATCDAILFGRKYSDVYREYYFRYPRVGYGKAFKLWATSMSDVPYNSFGNGSAMRVSPIAWAFNNEHDVLEEAKKSAEVTHNHPEGIKGAQAVALSIFMARKCRSKIEIKECIESMFGYDLNPPINEKWDTSCQGCVPQAFSAFFEANGFEDTIRRAIFKGGDSDTIAAIAGSIAQPFYGIPSKMIDQAFVKLTEDLSNIVEKFIRSNMDSTFKKPIKKVYDWKTLFDILTK